MDQKLIASRIDHTILKADATKDDIKKLCEEAKQYNFASVCINPSYVPLAYEILKDTSVKVCTVIGFPLGASRSSVKAFEAQTAVTEGAKEIDMVINIGFVKDKNYPALEEDVNAVVNAVKEKDNEAIVKVIIETCLLTDTEKEEVCRTLLKTKADFVKTSTGFSTGGATKEDVALMKKIVKDAMKVKASGGVRTYEDYTKMVEAGADRLGTSNGVAIVTMK